MYGTLRFLAFAAALSEPCKSQKTPGEMTFSLAYCQNFRQAFPTINIPDKLATITENDLQPIGFQAAIAVLHDDFQQGI